MDGALQVCRTQPGERGRFIKVVLALLQSTSTAVVYECAVTLVSLSQAPTAIRAAANCYTQQLVTQSDNNVKLIILDRLEVAPSTAGNISLSQAFWPSFSRPYSSAKSEVCNIPLY